MVLLEAELEDAHVHGGAHVVDVGHEHELPPLLDKLGEEARVVEGVVEVPVAGGVPSNSTNLF